MAIARAAAPAPPPAVEQPPCGTCPARSTCRALCASLEKQLQREGLQPFEEGWLDGEHEHHRLRGRRVAGERLLRRSTSGGGGDALEQLGSRLGTAFAEPDRGDDPDAVADCAEQETRSAWRTFVDECGPRLQAAILEQCDHLPAVGACCKRHVTPTQRAVLFAFLDGAHQSAIARQRGCTKETVCIMLRRARQRLAAMVPEVATVATPRGRRRQRDAA